MKIAVSFACYIKPVEMIVDVFESKDEAKKWIVDRVNKSYHVLKYEYGNYLGDFYHDGIVEKIDEIMYIDCDKIEKGVGDTSCHNFHEGLPIRVLHYYPQDNIAMLANLLVVKNKSKQLSEGYGVEEYRFDFSDNGKLYEFTIKYID